jgi:hypothetical protein
MKRVILFILLSIGFALGLRAQMVNNIPNYLYSGSLGVGRNVANDANVYLQVGPNGAGTKGMIVPWVADTAAISGTKRNFLFIRSSQLAAFAYWDSVNARWYKIGFTDTTTISTRLYAQKIVDDSSKVLRALASAVDGVTSVATGYGISGGTITSTGTLTADTSSLSTKLNTQKVVDDSSKVLRALIPVGGSRLDQITGATTTATVNHAANAIEWQWNTLTGANAYGLKLSSTSTAATTSETNAVLGIVRSGTNSNSSTTNRGISSTITNTGTLSFNYAGYFDASGGTTNYGVRALGSNYGVYASSSGTSGQAYGVYSEGGAVSVFGANGNANGSAIEGSAFATTGTNYAVKGGATGSGATTNYGGYFTASGATTNYGVYASGTGWGAFGTTATDGSAGIQGTSSGISAKGVYGTSTNTSGTDGFGVYGQSTGAKTSGYGGYFTSSGATNNYGVYVDAGITRLNGAFNLKQVSKTSTYTADDTDCTIFVDATSGAVTINLPTTGFGRVSGRIYIIKKTDASGNAVTIDGNSSETIDGATTYSLASQYKYVTIQSNGTNWFIIGNN